VVDGARKSSAAHLPAPRARGSADDDLFRGCWSAAEWEENARSWVFHEQRIGCSRQARSTHHRGTEGGDVVSARLTLAAPGVLNWTRW